MKNYKNISALLLGLMVITLFSHCSPKEKEETDPNIIFIFADDLTYTGIHALGNNEVNTPNLDRLVNGGTTFTNAYNMGSWSGAVCAASRAMIISGRSVWNANSFRQNWVQGKEMDKTWGKLIEGAGYDTYMTGKWHVDAPAESVFQNVVHIRPGMPEDAWHHEEQVKKFEEIKGTDTPITDLMPIGYHRPMSPEDTAWTPTDTQFGGYWEGGKHWSEVLAEDASGFINKAKVSDNPFFMYLAFNAPHDPRQAPQKYLDMYPLEDISIPTSWLSLYPFKDSIGCGPDLRDEALVPFPRTEYSTKKNIQEYYALLTHLDTQIGVILDALEESGKMDNTYIVFTADHGLAMGRHGLFGKQNLYDHSMRAPFIITGPDVPKGSRLSQDIYLQDAMATALDLAGATKPEYVEFNSLMPLVRGETDKGSYESVYGAYLNLQRAIRKEDFKLLVYPKINKVLLYDLKNDPEEMNDLSARPEFQNKLANLFDDLIVLQDKMNDPLDLSVQRQNLLPK